MDSRKNPTLKVSVYAGDIVGVFEVPSGASTGKYEACELRDEDNNKSGVAKAIKKIETIIKPALLGMDVGKQALIDETMITLDGTTQKTNLGGNSMIGVSIACAKAAALSNQMEVYEYLRTIANITPSRPVPFLYFNLINGGKHASSKLAFQEYHVVPQVDKIEESVMMCRNIQKKLDEIILKKYGNLPVKGDEGGLALSVDDIFVPLALLAQAADELGYSDKIMFALDVAASSFYDNEKKIYKLMNRDFAPSDMQELYKKICADYKMISIEDPFDEEDFESFASLQNILKSELLVGDDLTVTNKDRLSMAIKDKSIKAIIIKPNQIGTLSETFATMSLARASGIDCIVSHRSGETMDDFIADLAYAFGCFGIKAGALGPRERDVKYERLIKITK